MMEATREQVDLQQMGRLAKAAAIELAQCSTEQKNAALLAIADALERGGTVNIVGFGKFTTRHRAPRRGGNPRTGEAVAIPARTVPTFKAGKALRDRLND